MTEENPSISPPKRVAVVRLSAAGDVVLTTPALESLKAAWPETEIIYVTKALYHPLIEHHPAVSRVVPWGPEDSVGVVRARLLELGVDAVLDLHSSQRSRLLRWSLPGMPAVVWSKRPLLTNLTSVLQIPVLLAMGIAMPMAIAMGVAISMALVRAQETIWLIRVRARDPWHRPEVIAYGPWAGSD